MRFLAAAVLLGILGQCLSQTDAPECPSPWVPHDQYCYLFETNPRRSWNDASIFCQKRHAYLLSIDGRSEHDFIVTEIAKHNASLEWFTSGMVTNEDPLNPTFSWMAKKGFPNGVTIPGTLDFWLNTEAPTTNTGPYIAYTYQRPSSAILPPGTETDNPSWYWVRRPEQNRLAFVCEILKTDTELISTKPRWFDFGVEDAHPDRLEMGPRFVEQPSDTMFFLKRGDTTVEVNLMMNCEAAGLPQPMYTWYKVDGASSEGTRINVLESGADHYTLTNGRLTIHNPEINRDTGNYYCEAYNKFGTIRSHQASVQSEALLDFPQEARTIGSTQFNPKALTCVHNNKDSELEYTWFRANELEFINTQNTPHMFISDDGNLYISAVIMSDAGPYGCSIRFKSGGTDSRRSPTYTLSVTAQPQKEVKPTIPGPFPQIFPRNLRRGMDATLECYALGTTDNNDRFDYAWSRRDGRDILSDPDYAMLDWNRKLIIKNVDFEDQGTFTCTVTYKGSQAVKSIDLSIQSMPYFEAGALEDQFIDEGVERFAWACNAEAKPAPTYSWLKNGRPLVASDTVSFSIDNRVVTFTSPTKDAHEGMYQCMASNTVGIRYSSAQLTILRFAPSFAKFPLVGEVITAEGGNATIPCDPEAAPKAEITWFFNGAQITPTQTSTPIKRLPNSHLYIDPIQRGTHEGVYACRADNGVGNPAEVSTRLFVKSHTEIRIRPITDTYLANSTIHLPCVADYDQLFDIKYIWQHNTEAIDFEDWRLQNFFARDVGGNRGGLVIKRASYEQRGRYTCIARTISDEVKVFADIHIVGRPGEPTGVKASNPGMHTATLKWVAGSAHGSAITGYDVQHLNTHTKKWVPSKTVYNSSNILATTTMVGDLFANTAYVFRVRAKNKYGYGPYSRPSTEPIVTQPDRPTMVPANIGGGGGREGDLNITWTPLPREQWNGPNVWYEVRYKEQGSPTLEYKTTAPNKIPQSEAGRWVTQFNVNKYYTPYEVKVIAHNDLGSGPEGDPVIVYSAEGVPRATPEETVLLQYNATALSIEWIKPEYSRDKFRGVLLGYRAKYWKSSVPEDQRDLNQFRATFMGDVEAGLIIGLEPSTDYMATIQMFNSAGDGTEGRSMEQTTFMPAPQQAPEYVTVENIPNSNDFRVHWRGISTTPDEEPLDGYMVRIWKQGEDLATYQDFDAGRDSVYVVKGFPVDPITVYNLRVFGYSRGGVGRLSSPMTQFVIGCDARQQNLEAEWVYLCSSAQLTQYSPLVTLSLAALALLGLLR